MHVWQMNNGRWQVDAYTGASPTLRRLAMHAPSFETRAEAEAWRKETMEKARRMDEDARRIDHGAEQAAADAYGV